MDRISKLWALMCAQKILKKLHEKAGAQHIDSLRVMAYVAKHHVILETEGLLRGDR